MLKKLNHIVDQYFTTAFEDKYLLVNAGSYLPVLRPKEFDLQEIAVPIKKKIYILVQKLLL